MGKVTFVVEKDISCPPGLGFCFSMVGWLHQGVACSTFLSPGASDATSHPEPSHRAIPLPANPGRNRAALPLRCFLSEQGTMGIGPSWVSGCSLPTTLHEGPLSVTVVDCGGDFMDTAFVALVLTSD